MGINNLQKNGVFYRLVGKALLWGHEIAVEHFAKAILGLQVAKGAVMAPCPVNEHHIR